MKNRVFIFLMLLVLVNVNELTGQERLDYNAFLKHVEKNSPLAGNALNNQAIAKAQYHAALGNYDPQISMSAENKFFNSKNYYSAASAEIKQPLYASNYIKAGYLYGQGINIDPERVTPVSGQPFMGFETSLLQGLLFDKRRADLLKAKYYSDFYTLEQKIKMNDLLYMASSSYAELLYASRRNSLHSYFADLASQRLKGIGHLASVGERAAIDTVEAHIFLQSRLLEKQSVQTELLKQYNELLYFYSGKEPAPLQTPVLSDSLEALYIRFLKKSNSGPEKSLNNPLLEQYQAKQGLLETEARFKRELIKPVLNVSYNFLGAQSTGDAVLFHPNNYKWGASFSFPLFLRKPRFEYKLARIASNNNQLETSNKQNELTYKQNYLLNALQITGQQISNAEQATRSSKVLVEAERIKFQNGESSLFLLNTREAKWLESGLKEIEYKFKYICLSLELMYVNGVLDYSISD